MTARKPRVPPTDLGMVELKRRRKLINKAMKKMARRRPR